MKIVPRPCMDRLTTIGIRAYCEGLITINSLSDLDEVSNFLERHKIRGFFIGRGSNIIPCSDYIPCFLLKIKELNEFSVIGDDGKNVIIRADGGSSLRRLISWSMKKGFSGLEGLAGIPGTVGGAIAMNAGSFGREISELVFCLRLWNSVEGIVELRKEQTNFLYRRFNPPFEQGLWCVLSVDLELQISNAQKVKEVIKQNYIKKKTHQPVTNKTCGCVFKNPILYPAGYLLEKVGMKGKGIGGMRFSNLHANFLINEGNGTPSQAMELIEEAKNAVFESYGINLELEVKLFS